MPQSTGRYRSNPLSGEFFRSGVERNYRDGQARRELLQLRVIWSLAIASFALFAPLEQWLSGSVGSGWSIPRLLIVALGAITLAATWVLPQVRYRDFYTSLALLLVMTAYGCLLAGRGNGLVTADALLLLVVGNYCFSPGRFVLLCAAGLGGSMSAALMAWWLAPAGSVHWLQFCFLLPANLLAALALGQINRSRRACYRQGLQLRREAARRRRAQQALQVLHRRNLSLLHNTLPATIAGQLAIDPRRKLARHHDLATVLFADIVGFSELCRRLSATQLVNLLNRLFSQFDLQAERYGLEKIKTVGDAYLAVSGVNTGSPGDSCSTLRFASLLQQTSFNLGKRLGLPLRLRTGVHVGPLVAGVIGDKRYAFDVWGETVNIASRLQTAAEPGDILVSARARECACGSLEFGPSRSLALRGCGEVRACKLLLPASVAQFSSDQTGDRIG